MWVWGPGGKRAHSNFLIGFPGIKVTMGIRRTSFKSEEDSGNSPLSCLVAGGCLFLPGERELETASPVAMCYLLDTAMDQVFHAVPTSDREPVGALPADTMLLLVATCCAV
jgi:hypothetical protein